MDGMCTVKANYFYMSLCFHDRGRDISNLNGQIQILPGKTKRGVFAAIVDQIHETWVPEFFITGP